MPVLDLDTKPHVAAGTALHVFAVKAAQDPQVMLRIAGLFAQRNIVPHQLSCRSAGGRLLIDIEVQIDSLANAQRLLERMRSIVLVERVSLLEGRA